MERHYKEIHKLKLEDTPPEEDQSYKIKCPSCSSIIPAEDINIIDKLAKCSSCDSVFLFNVEDITSKSDAPEETYIKPSNISVIESKDGVEIKLRDKKGIKGFMITLYMISVGLLILLLTQGISEITVTLNIIAWAFTLWYSYTYRDMSQKVYIDIHDDELTMEYDPWFFTIKKVIRIDTIQEVYLQKTADPYGSANEFYQIKLRIDKGDGVENIKLIPWTFLSIEEASYIEREIQRVLNMTDDLKGK